MSEAQVDRGLESLRAAFARGGRGALEGLVGGGEGAQGAASLEWLGWSALHEGKQAWGYIALRAALTGYEREEQASEAEGLRAYVEALEQSFEPYGSDEALLEDVRAWMSACLLTLKEGEGEPAPGAAREAQEQRLELRHRWLFRLQASRRGGSALRLWGLVERLGLTLEDAFWVLMLAGAETHPSFQQQRRKWFNDDPHYTAGFLVQLFASERGEEVRMLERLEPRAPLLRQRLVYLNPPQSRPHTPLRNRFVEVDEAVLAWLEGRDAWPWGIDHVVTHHEAGGVVGEGYFQAKVERLEQLRVRHEEDGGALVALCTPSWETGKELGRAWARARGRGLLEVAVRGVQADPAAFEALLRLVLREARLRDAEVYVHSGHEWDAAKPGTSEVLGALRRGAKHHPGLILVDSSLDGDEALRRELTPLYEVRLNLPGLDEQARLWSEALVEAGAEPLSEQELKGQVCEVALPVEEIVRAARLATREASLSVGAGEQARVSPEALRRLAADARNKGMFSVAERVRTTFTWDDVVLPPHVLESLMAVITYARYQQKVFEEWGFGSKVPYGRANSSLFTGPPGTGKTMTASIIARELGMDLFRVEISTIVSKYVGETEKNLAKVFDEAASGHAVLLFDEADALFTKRTEVKSSNDRYSNLEVNYLLQKIESFEGVTILTTNNADNIDEAFARRIKFKVNFPFPDEQERARLWEFMLPSRLERAEVIDFRRLGRAFDLAGGNIKNAVLRAAFQAAEAGAALDTEFLERAGIAESREMGKLVRERDGKVVLL